MSLHARGVCGFQGYSAVADSCKIPAGACAPRADASVSSDIRNVQCHCSPLQTAAMKGDIALLRKLVDSSKQSMDGNSVSGQMSLQ